MTAVTRNTEYNVVAVGGGPRAAWPRRHGWMPPHKLI